MENGSEHGRSPAYLAYFELSNNFAWRASRPQEIEQRRAMLDDLLIFDILLRSGGIRSPDILYPPRDEPALLRLLEAIENSNYDTLKKDCLIYFLLKWHQDGREDRYAAQRCIPPQFTALADAYWHLDSGINLARGVSILADPRLNRDYASKILQAISLSADPSTLVRKYVRTAKPPLTEPDDIELYTLALADSSLLEAWQFQRTFHESNEIRPCLLQKILEWCVAPKPRPSALMQLLSLPLSTFEESTLHSYVLRPPATLPLDALPLLQDVVCVRMIQLGRYVDAIRMDRKFTSSKVGANSRQAQERSKMVQDLYDALPAIEQAFVDVELASHAVGGKPHKPGQRSSAGEDVDMSQSWEEIRPSDLQSSVSKPPVSRAIPERANAPRFGGPIPIPSTLPTLPQRPTSLGTPAAPRQSFPLSTVPMTFSSPSGSQPRLSLSNTAGRMVLSTLPHVSSPLSGAKFPTPASSQPPKPTGNPFVSANQQANAFYKPPSRANGHIKPPFPTVQPPTDASPNTHERTKGDDVDMDDEKENPTQEEANEQRGASEPRPTEEQELGFSVFGNDISSWTNVENKVTGTSLGPGPTAKSHSKSASMKRKVPGSFGDDDEDEDMDEHHVTEPQEPEEEEAISGRTTRSGQSASAHSTTTKKARSKRNESKDPKRRRGSPRLPGSLIDDDGEEEDQVAPLRGTRGPGRKPGASVASGRISRGSTASDLVDELGDGMRTRRRSSRLTTAASTGSIAGGEGEVSPKKTRTRKPTAKTTTASGRKKRAT